MDAFTRRGGRPSALHLPRLSHLLARVIIREEHMQQTALGMLPRAPSPRVRGWKTEVCRLPEVPRSSYRGVTRRPLGVWVDLVLFSGDNIHVGQQGFLKCGLMRDGTFWGRGALFRASRADWNTFKMNYRCREAVYGIAILRGRRGCAGVGDQRGPLGAF
jgi:hypothetical protein